MNYDITTWIIIAVALLNVIVCVILLLQKRKGVPERPHTEPLLPSIQPEGDQDALWQRLSHLMDVQECWRDPDTSVESISKTLGTNRIYVARCVREHTGLSFNDFVNSKRVDYMALQLKTDPSQNQKELYFASGFRSRHAAYRNFVKFKGCSPSDFISSIPPK